MSPSNEESMAHLYTPSCVVLKPARTLFSLGFRQACGKTRYARVENMERGEDLIWLSITLVDKY